MTLRIAPTEIVERAEQAGKAGLLEIDPRWSRIKLGRIARVINGAPFKSRLFNAEGRGMPLIRIRDVGSSSIQTWYDGPWDEQQLVRHGDLLVGMDGDFRAARWEGPEALLNQRVCRIAVTSAEYDDRFLALLLQGYLDAIWNATSSVTVKHLSSRSITEIPLPNPPFETQRRIVEILEDHLSRLDAAVASLDLATRRSVQLRASVLSAEADAARLVRLGKLLERIESGRSLGTATRRATASEWGIVRVSSMTYGVFRPEENKYIDDALVNPAFEIKDGDVLMSRANTSEYVGAAVYVRHPPPRRLLSDKSLRIVPRKDVNPEWLTLMLSSPNSRRQLSASATGTKDSMRNLSRATIEGILVPNLDPDQQRAAVERISRIDPTIERLRTEIAAARVRAEALRRALLTAAFSGKLTRAASVSDRIDEFAAAL